MTATPAPELQDLLAPGQEDMIDGFLEELEHTTDVMDDLANAVENVVLKNA